MARVSIRGGGRSTKRSASRRKNLREGDRFLRRMLAKVILAAALVGLLGSGCGGGGGTESPDEVVAGFVAAWNRHDGAAVCQYYTDHWQLVYAQAAATLVTPGLDTCERFMTQSQFKGDPAGRWKAEKTTLKGNSAVGSAVPTNKRGPLFVSAIPLVKVGDSWRVDGAILSRFPPGRGPS
jgi:hypothetical protein